MAAPLSVPSAIRRRLSGQTTRRKQHRNPDPSEVEQRRQVLAVSAHSEVQTHPRAMTGNDLADRVPAAHGVTLVKVRRHGFVA